MSLSTSAAARVLLGMAREVRGLAPDWIGYVPGSSIGGGPMAEEDTPDVPGHAEQDTGGGADVESDIPVGAEEA